MAVTAFESRWILVAASTCSTLLGGAFACGSSASLDASGANVMTARAADPSGLRHTLDDLAAMASEGTEPGGFAPGLRVGSPQGLKAANYLRDRFHTMGFSDVGFEPFHFPQHRVAHAGSSLSFSNGPSGAVAFDVFEGSGAGRVENGELVSVGTAKPEELAGVDLHGKIAFVKRDPTFHRSSQLRNVAAAGAVAMLYQSDASNNLIQIGSVRTSWEAMVPIPAITVGRDDGNAIRSAIASALASHAQAPRASVTVSASTARAAGQNVVARIPGADPAHQIVIGAH